MAPSDAVDQALEQLLDRSGGDYAVAVGYAASALRTTPADPVPYAVLARLRAEHPAEFTAGLPQTEYAAQGWAHFLGGELDQAAKELGTAVAHQPEIAWADAPWFEHPSFLDGVSGDGLAHATLRINAADHDLDNDAMRTRLAPWLRAVEAVASRAGAEALARMAILYRRLGRTDESLALCDRADTVDRVAFTEVVRAGTLRRFGDLDGMAEAFERALALDPADWTHYLDMADVRAGRGDFAGAVNFVVAGRRVAPKEVTLQAADAAYRTRLTGSPLYLRELIELAPRLADIRYKAQLIEIACAAPKLPRTLTKAARKA
ncbi:hypothetical protein ACWKSP_26905 [Micromonosporaceae bacterium Da 78-11]